MHGWSNYTAFPFSYQSPHPPFYQFNINPHSYQVSLFEAFSVTLIQSESIQIKSKTILVYTSQSKSIQINSSQFKWIQSWSSSVNLVKSKSMRVTLSQSESIWVNPRWIQVNSIQPKSTRVHPSQSRSIQVNPSWVNPRLSHCFTFTPTLLVYVGSSKVFAILPSCCCCCSCCCSASRCCCCSSSPTATWKGTGKILQQCLV